MRKFTPVAVVSVALLILGIASPGAHASDFAPTSFEIVYQPVYSLATGGPSSQLSPLGGGIRIGYAMTPHIAFELGGYYDGYTFGAINGSNETAYAARATGAFALVPSPALRLYLGIDANVFFSPPAAFTATGNKDLGAIGGVRLLLGGGTKVFVGAEYRYGVSTIFTYSGGSINNSALMGNFGIHFGGV